jgi:alkylation response protein AidB-like acyl-CoA dehydrogenase
VTAVERALGALQEVAGLVEAHATDADRNGELASSVMKALHAQGLFRLLLPMDVGGQGMSLAEAFPVFEAAAQLDGAVGWNLSIGCITLAAVHAQLGTDRADRVLRDPDTIIAGGVTPGSVHARRVSGGYRFSGHVRFASGSAHATWLFTAATTAGASPGQRLVGGLIEPAAVTLLDAWHVTGLRATSSTDFLLDDVFVPDELTFPFDLGPPPDGPIETLPMASTLGVALAFVALGVAGHALVRLLSLATTRSPFGSADVLAARTDVQIATARSRALIDAGRAYVLATWHGIQTELVEGRTLTIDDLARLRLSYVTATQNAIVATDLAWASAGSSAIYEGESLERCWRDVHVVGHHHFVSARHLDRLGRITLGLPPGPGPI